MHDSVICLGYKRKNSNALYFCNAMHDWITSKFATVYSRKQFDAINYVIVFLMARGIMRLCCALP